MPVILAPIIGLAIGTILALTSHRGRGAGRPSAERAALWFGLLVYAPVCGWTMWTAPDWSLSYLVSSSAVPSAINLLLAVGAGLTPAAGVRAFRRLQKSGSERALLAISVGPATLALITAFALAPRLATVATYRQVEQQFGGESLFGSSLGYAVLWMTIAIGAGLAVCLSAVAGPSSRSPFLGPTLSPGQTRSGRERSRRPMTLGGRPASSRNHDD